MITTPAIERARSRGRFELVRVLQGTTQTEVAEVCGVTRSAVAYWASGRSRPASGPRQSLFDAFGIHPSSWGVASPWWVRRKTFRANVKS